MRRLQLAALAVLGFDLQRTVVVGQDGAGLDIAVFFVKNIHEGYPRSG
jgi:hypothetical protein